MTAHAELGLAVLALIAITVAMLALYGEMVAVAFSAWNRRRQRRREE